MLARCGLVGAAAGHHLADVTQICSVASSLVVNCSRLALLQHKRSMLQAQAAEAAMSSLDSVQRRQFEPNLSLHCKAAGQQAGSMACGCTWRL